VASRDEQFVLKAMRESGVPTSVVHVDSFEMATNFLMRQADFAGREGEDPCLIVIEAAQPDDHTQDFVTLLRTSIKKPLPTILLCDDCPQDRVRALYDAGLNSLLVMPADFEQYGDWLFETLRYWVHLNCARILMA